MTRQELRSIQPHHSLLVNVHGLACLILAHFVKVSNLLLFFFSTLVTLH